MTDPMYGIVPHTKTQVRCVLCGVNVPKALRCIEQHSKGAKHLQCIKMMKQQGMTFKDQALHCKPCNAKLSHDDAVEHHVEGHDHGAWLNIMEVLSNYHYIDFKRYMSLESEDANCVVCGINIRCCVQDIEAHVKTNAHKTSIYNFVKHRNGMIAVNNNTKVWCKVCNIFFDNNVVILLKHLDTDREHIKWFMAVEDLIEHEDVSIESFLTVENETKAYCNRCGVKIICNARGLEAHVQSEAHSYKVV